MSNISLSAHFRNGLTNFLFYLLLFSYPLLSILWRRSYPIFSAEVLLLFAIIVGMSLVFSVLAARTRSAIDYLLTGILILLVFIIQFDLFLEGIVICIGLTALLLFMQKKQFRLYCLPVLIALIVAAFLDSRHEPLEDRSEANTALVNAELPPVLHILLDGFIGIAGLPPYPASDVIRHEILSFLETNNFQLFSHAYSRYAWTADSVNAAMNYRHDGDGIAYIGGENHSAFVMTENALFSSVADLGYRLNIYQTGHLNLCKSNPGNLDRCWQYDHPNINSVIDSENTVFKSRMLAWVLIHQSKLLVKTLETYNVDFPSEIAVHDPRVFDRLEKDIGRKGGGNYFFGHVLLPHGPYAYQPDCSVSYKTPFSLRVAYRLDEPVQSKFVYEVRNGLYFAQIDCALRSLQLLINSMKEQGLYDRAIVILQGDHGSGIVRQLPTVRNFESMRKQDYRTSFSTLFAVKYPGSKFAIDEQALPISYLTEEFMALLPSFVSAADRYTAFSPSRAADNEKTDSYVYLGGTYPKRRVDIDLFED